MIKKKFRRRFKKIFRTNKRQKWSYKDIFDSFFI